MKMKIKKYEVDAIFLIDEIIDRLRKDIMKKADIIALKHKRENVIKEDIEQATLYVLTQ